MEQLSGEATGAIYLKGYLSKEGRGDIAIARKAERKRDEEWIKWGDSECPHGIKHKTVKRKCFKCWQEIKGKVKKCRS